MYTMKKFLALLLALVCLATLCVPAYATENVTATSVEENELTPYASYTLHRAVGVNGSAITQSVEVTLIERCTAFRVFGIYANGSTGNTSVEIWNQARSYRYYYFYPMAINGAYTPYQSINLAPGTYYIVFTHTQPGNSYQAGAYFYN